MLKTSDLSKKFPQNRMEDGTYNGFPNSLYSRWKIE